MKYRSQDTLEKDGKTFRFRTCLKSMGFTDYELENRPLVGIVNSGNNMSRGIII